ncbi:hypothetical protein BC629DRAFT_1461213 [Irpex lacteus]|nr:hypothetical protein BC629DRAFT_1461213 [Irpex lacteus]
MMIARISKPLTHQLTHSHITYLNKTRSLLNSKMSGILNKLKPSSHKHDSGDNKSSEGEQQFSIQPHPARTNDPRDLEPPQVGGGLNSNPEQQAFHTPGPYIPKQELTQNLEKPKGRDELRARSAELNKDN